MKRFEFAHVAEGIARQAGALLRGYYEKGVETEYKGDVDLVTVADRSCEQLIREKLTAAFPEHGIYGEEGTRDQMESEYRWYVDPLDGTTNFAHGFPAFCVILGLERRAAGLAKDEDGEIVAGVIYDPLRDEMFVAERGKGVVAERQGDPCVEDADAGRVADGDGISIAEAAQLAECAFLSGDHAAVAWGAAGGVGGAGSGVCGVRAAGWVLGVQSESVGHQRGDFAGGGGGRDGDALRWREVYPGLARGVCDQWADQGRDAAFVSGDVCGSRDGGDSDAGGVCGEKEGGELNVPQSADGAGDGLRCGGAGVADSVRGDAERWGVPVLADAGRGD